jgi:5-methylphenazine-1-carboxylate 1-monooxygenase
MRALVVGAGLGGLPAALKLHARGIETLVFESVSEIGALGVGIAFCPRARAS